MKDDAILLDHIRECLDWIDELAADGEAAVLEDRRTRDAILRNLQVLAESTQRLSPGLRATHPEIFWQGIAGFRNVLVHDYLGLRADRVWNIIRDDLPPLRVAIESMIEALGR